MPKRPLCKRLHSAKFAQSHRPDYFLSLENSYAPMSQAAPCGLATPSWSVARFIGAPASIAGLPGRRWKLPVDAPANFGSEVLLAERNDGAAPAPKKRLLLPV